MITLEEFKKKHSDKCRLIGLDLGSKRIGVSICDEKQLIATPLKTINRNTLTELISELKVIINENDVNRYLNLELTGSSFLKECKKTKLNFHEVSKEVNKPTNNNISLIQTIS